MKGPYYVLKQAVGTVHRHVSEGRGMHACVVAPVLLPASADQSLIGPHELIFCSLRG